MRAYTMRERKCVLEYLVEHKAYEQTKGRKLWMILADSSLTDRSWQSLKENFQKRILPDIHNPYYGLSMEQIRSFRQGRDLTTKDVPLSQDNVQANSENPRAIAENMEAVNDAGEADSHSHIRSSMETSMLTREERNAGEEDSQLNSSHSSSMETLILVIEESSNQEGAESNECSENISSTKLTITQPVVEVSDNVTERVSVTQNGCVSPINSDSDYDAIPIRKNCNNRDKSPQFKIGPSRKQQTNKDHSVSTKNVQSKSVLSSDSHFRNDPHESLKGFNNDEIAKAMQEKANQEAKRRNSLAYSNRRNSIRVQGNCQKTNISENRDCHVRTINDSRDNENVRINGNPTCSKYMQQSLRSSLEDQSNEQSSTVTNRDSNKERDTKIIMLNSKSDSDSDDLIEKRKRIKRKRSISRMPQLEREALQKILRMPLANLDAEGPRKKCNCSKTCALSKNNAAGRQSDILELSSSDGEMPGEPYKAPEEEREFWKQKYIDQEKKTNGIIQSLQKIKTKLDCQENAFADLRKQIASDKNFAFIDDERTSRTEDEDKENCVKIHIVTKSQDIRLRGDWKDICSDFKELLKVLKIASPTNSSNNAATATVEELHDNELQSHAVANNVPVRRGRKAENKKRSVSSKEGSKGKSPRGRPKSKKNVDKDGTKKSLTPVRKSLRISKMKSKKYSDDDDDEQTDDRYYTPPKKIYKTHRRNTIK